jgi:hypothetical protein
MSSSREVQLPPSKIVIKDGQVVSLEDWVLWNGEPAQTLFIERQADGQFFCSAGDPEHGGGSTSGTLAEIMEWMSYHPKFRGPMTKVFELENATEASVLETGLDRYKIEIV